MEEEKRNLEEGIRGMKKVELGRKREIGKE